MENETQALVQEISELRSELELERGRRIAAEALATERLSTLSIAQQMVANLSEQLAERFRSLDAFATKMLDQRQTEKTPTAPYRMERLPQQKVTAGKYKEPNPAEFYQTLKQVYGQNLKPDASKYPAVAAAIEKMAEDQIQ